MSSPPQWSMCMWVSTTSVKDARLMPAASSLRTNRPACGRCQPRVHPDTSVDEDGPAAATHHGYVQRPLEHFRRQELVLQPGRPDGGFDIVRNSQGWNLQHTVADNQHVNRANLLRVARWNQLIVARPTGDQAHVFNPVFGVPRTHDMGSFLVFLSARDSKHHRFAVMAVALEFSDVVRHGRSPAGVLSWIVGVLSPRNIAQA